MCKKRAELSWGSNWALYSPARAGSGSASRAILPLQPARVLRSGFESATFVLVLVVFATGMALAKLLEKVLAGVEIFLSTLKPCLRKNYIALLATKLTISWLSLSDS